MLVLPGNNFFKKILVPNCTIETLLAQELVEELEPATGACQFEWKQGVDIDSQWTFLIEALPDSKQKQGLQNKHQKQQLKNTEEREEKKNTHTMMQNVHEFENQATSTSSFSPLQPAECQDPQDPEQYLQAILKESKATDDDRKKIATIAKNIGISQKEAGRKKLANFGERMFGQFASCET